MFRGINLIMIALLIGVVSWTFKVKHDSQIAQARVAELEAQIAAEKTEIDLLKSDWSLLTSPGRLQDLVERYGEELNLKPMQPGQMARKDELPGYRLEFEPATSPLFDGFVEADKAITTGGINTQGEVSQ